MQFGAVTDISELSSSTDFLSCGITSVFTVTSCLYKLTYQNVDHQTSNMTHDALQIYL